VRKKLRQRPAEKIWAGFQEREKLSDGQLLKFQQYEALLAEWNRSMNLTAITGASETVDRHFSDSLVLRQFLDISKINLMADVGSGAGFPGVPLKIMFPHLGVILLEVTRKKQKFLRALIDQLELKDIQVCDMDWRTFLRTTESGVECFLARASIDPEELCRMFKPGCVYNQAKLVYWASETWEPQVGTEPFIKKEFPYTIKRKKRKLVLLSAL